MPLHHPSSAKGVFVGSSPTRKFAENRRGYRSEVLLHNVHFECDLVDDMRLDATFHRHFHEEKQVYPVVDDDGFHAFRKGRCDGNWLQQFYVQKTSAVPHVLPQMLSRASQADLTHGNEKGTVSFKPAVNDLSQKANFLRLRFSSLVKVLASSIDLISVGSNSFKVIWVTVAAKADSIVSELKASWSVGASA